MTTTGKTNWTIDPSHTEIQFKVKHLVIATVTGKFDKFEGRMEASQDDFSDAVLYFTADVNSVNTNAPDRDTHLKSADFFDAGAYPVLSFKSTGIQKKSDSKYKITGDITIRGVTHTIVLDVIYGGTITDPWGNIKAGFELTGKLNRKDFGLNWNAVTEAGGIVVSDEVRIVVNTELVKQ